MTDPSHRTQIPRAVKDPRVIVARTFSKAHGMAGMRVGYAIGHPDTIKKLTRWEGPGALNVAGHRGRRASSIKRPGPARPRAGAQHRGAPVHDRLVPAQAASAPTDSQTNFIFVDIKRPAKEFRDACRGAGGAGGARLPALREEPPAISIGTLDEMKRATAVFGKILLAPAAAA